MSADEVAQIMHMSVRTVYRYAELFGATDDIQKSIQRNGPLQTLSEHKELFIVNLVLTRPGMCLREIQTQLSQRNYV